LIPFSTSFQELSVSTLPFFINSLNKTTNKSNFRYACWQKNRKASKTNEAARLQQPYTICMLLGRLPTAQIWSHFDILHWKNKLAGIIELFPARERLVSGIPAGDRKIGNLFLQCAASVVDASQEHFFAL
jgi:hypothetical protein